MAPDAQDNKDINAHQTKKVLQQIGKEGGINKKNG